MTALTLLRHAIGLLLHQPLKTLTVIFPALVLMIAVSIIATLTAPEIMTNGSGDGALEGMPKSWPLILALVFSYSMMAILWHRHTLSTVRAPVPMTVPLVLGYLWRVVILTIIQLTVSLALITPLIISSQSGDGPGGGPAFHSILLTTFVTQLLLVWLSLRLSLILPAAALGRPIKLALSWRYTRALSRQLWSIAAMLALVNTAITSLVSYFDLTKSHHVLMLELPIYIIEGLLIFSILTTLYARQVQKVPLNQT